jgi:hypothetical protein
VPTITIDRDELVREIDDLIAANADATAKTTAYTAAITARDDVRAVGDAAVIAAQNKADADAADAEAALSAADVAKQVASALLTAQIEHLRKLVGGETSTDPTPPTP